MGDAYCSEHGGNVDGVCCHCASAEVRDAEHRVDAVIDDVARVLDEAGIGRAPGGDHLDRMRLLVRERNALREVADRMYISLRAMRDVPVRFVPDHVRHAIDAYEKATRGK